jgi:TetR/AcrR family transcriptional regulator, cholesterol catabolism regulator
MAMRGTLTERQAARRDRVIEAAMELANEGGYDAVQMREVASRARVALGTLYRYFSSKDQLLVAAMAHWTRQLEGRLAERPPPGETPADRVTDVLLRASRTLERAPELTAAVVTALSSLTTDDPEALEFAREVYLVMHDIIEHAMDDGEVPEKDAVIRVLGEVWLAVLVARVRGWAEPGEMAQDLETAVRLLVPGSAEARARVLAKTRT